MVGESAQPKRRSGSTLAILHKLARASVGVISQSIRRALVWAVLGLFLGVVCDMACLVMSKLPMVQGAMPMTDPWLVVVGLVLPFFGAAVFALYGAEAGALRALLDAGEETGIVRHVVDESLLVVEDRFGKSLRGVPRSDVLWAISDGSRQALGEPDDEWRGLLGWVAGKVLLWLAKRFRSIVESAYDAERSVAGDEGELLVVAVSQRAGHAVTDAIEALIAWVLSRQLVVSVIGFLVVGIGWYPLVWRLRTHIPSFVS